MAERIIPSCGRCVCYVQTSAVVAAMSGKLGAEEQGNCHRHPPQIVSVSHKTMEGLALVPGAMFPQVAANWWCAEFRPRPPVTGTVENVKPAAN